MNETLTLGAAFLAGLAASAHCVGMCGGIASLMSAGARHRALLHNIGRILTYALGGALVGGLGAGAGWLVGGSDFLTPLRLILGLAVIAIGLQLLTGRRLFAPAERLGMKLWRRLQPVTGSLL